MPSLTSPGQLAMGAAGTPASTRISKPSRPIDPTEYGMSLWFEVSVDTGFAAGTTYLGNWSFCNGLGIRFERDLYKQGGNYGSHRGLPDRLSYPEVTLKRAMTKKDSKQVQDWLAEVGKSWVGENTTWSQPRSTMVIRVFHGSSFGLPVAEWTLKDVVPVSWSAPQLDSSRSEVAIETLVLAHEGFLPGVHTSEPDDQRNLVLRLDGNPSAPVRFWLPPQVVMTRSALLTIKNGNEKVHDRTVTSDGLLDFHVNDLLVDGAARVSGTVARLMEWLTPDKRGAGGPTTISGTQMEVKAKRLRMNFGSGAKTQTHLVVLTSVNVTYTRFDSTGRPCRAKVNLSLTQATEDPDPHAPAWQVNAASANLDDPLRPTGRAR